MDLNQLTFWDGVVAGILSEASRGLGRVRHNDAVSMADEITREALRAKSIEEVFDVVSTVLGIGQAILEKREERRRQYTALQEQLTEQLYELFHTPRGQKQPFVDPNS